MKKLLLFILIITSNIFIGQGSVSIKDEGSVMIRFYTDTTEKEVIKPFDCYITFNRVTKGIPYDESLYNSPILEHIKPGVYDFHIKSKEYKYIIISDVEVHRNLMTSLHVTNLVLKEIKMGNDTIKIKWHVPVVHIRLEDNTFKMEGEPPHRGSMLIPDTETIKIKLRTPNH